MRGSSVGLLLIYGFISNQVYFAVFQRILLSFFWLVVAIAIVSGIYPTVGL